MSESINIILKALANSSVSRSTRGIVMLVIKDANVTKYKEYNSYKQVEEGYEDKNLKLIDKAFNKYGVKHLKVVTYQSDVAEALAKINNVKFNYLAAPEVTESADKENIIAFIGDGSLTGGEAYEGLNNASVLNSNFIVIVNDNDM